MIATFELYAGAVAAAGVDFHPMRPSADAFGDPARFMHQLLDLKRGPEFLVRHMFMPHVRESYADLYDATEGADALMSHPITFAGPLVAEKRALPWASTVLAPLSLMSALDPPVLPGAGWLFAVRKLGVVPYRVAFSLAKAIVGSWEAPLRELRRELGIPSSKRAQFEGQYSPYLNLALFSPVLAQPQPDWPAHTAICGFPHYEGCGPEEATTAALERFLADGKAPVVFGLGSSAVTIADEFWPIAIAAALQLGRRAVLLTGRHAPPPSTPPGIAAFPYLPYSAIFPRAAALVHTCGIGTLAQALRSRRPQLIVPVAFDQPDNARRAAILGVGRVLPFQRVTVDRLASELQRVLDTPAYVRAATAVGARLSNEDGAVAACDALERLTG